jgi:hypothetical protein
VLSDTKNNLHALLLAAGMVENEGSRNSGLRATKTVLLKRSSTKHIDQDVFSEIPTFFVKTFGTLLKAGKVAGQVLMGRRNHSSSVHPEKVANAGAAPAGTTKAGAPDREENGFTETKLAIDAGKARKSRKRLGNLPPIEERKKGKGSGAPQILVEAKGESA